jgi:1-acyl-sn-glycerol-3-phosphate acyltransferase
LGGYGSGGPDRWKARTGETVVKAPGDSRQGDGGHTELTRLTADGSDYRSPPRRASLPGRIFPSFAFYSALAPIVWKSSALAKRGRYGSREWIRSSHDVLRALERVGIPVEITGIRHLAGLEGPCVVVGNHMSVLETFVLPGVIEPIRPVTFVVKESLMTYPVFGHVMRSRDPIAVTRTHPRQDLKAVMDGGRERLARGVSLVVFPQTTRRPCFLPEEFNTIGIKLAQRAGVPVVPMALLTDAWGNGKRLKDFGRIDPSRPVHIAFGEPLHVEGRGASEHEAVIGFIQEKLEKWRTPLNLPVAS